MLRFALALVSCISAVAALASPLASPLTCYNDAGQPVDSWFMIKAPKGTGSLYYDATQQGFTVPQNSLNSTTGGALATTLQQAWINTTDYLIFNDEPAGSTKSNSTVGHTKGVWMWSDTTAVVLQHSIPLFPAGPKQTSTYKGLGGNAYTYAQHLACFTFPLSELAAVAAQTPLTVPGLYDVRVSPNAPAALKALANGAYSKQPLCTQTRVQTSAQTAVTYFAKSTQWNNELYAACVAPALRASLAVESWIRGSATGPACGKAQQVLDVQALAYPFINPFSETNDHSKWAVSLNATSSWVCPADINRMSTQFVRGGSAFCFQDPVLASALRKAISATNQCAKRGALRSALPYF